MRLKEGASIENVSWRMWYAALVAEPIWKKRGAELVITSGRDGRHGPGTLHYCVEGKYTDGIGRALDLRTFNLMGAEAEAAKELKAALGPDYDVVLEKDHIHVEYDPK